MSAERGVIQFKDRARQLNSFKDLVRMRNITPTDIDCLIDYNGNAFIYSEGKFSRDKKMETGQRIALEHVVNSHWKANHPAMALLFWHETPVQSEVPVAWQFVKVVYTLRIIPCLTGKMSPLPNWYWPQTQMIRVKDAIGYFEETFKSYNL